MKNIIILLSTTLFSLTVLAQDDTTQNATPTDHAGMTFNLGERAPFEIDTLYINSGKAYVILMDVQKDYDDDTVSIHGGPVDDEEKELLKNFEDNSFEIIKQYQHTLILFENGQKLDLSSIDNTFQGLAYWHGNLEDDVKLKQTVNKSTEFVAEQMGLNTKSSYVINNEKYKNELDLLKNKNEFTDKSKLLMHAFLDDGYKAFLTNQLGQNANLFNSPPENLKKMNLYISSGNEQKILKRSIEMNAKGQIEKLILFDRAGKISQSIDYIYENDILTKTVSDGRKTTTFSYADDKMMSFQNIGGANEINVYYLKNGEKNFKNYIIMIDEAYASQNTLSQTITEKNCKIRYINDAVWSRNCFTDQNNFPYVHTYTSYQDGEVMQYRKFKIEKENEKLYKKYYSNATQDSDKDEYMLNGTYVLNKDNLVTNYTIIDDQEIINLEIEYIYNN
ncbi:hypothetical protein [Psychroserpens sp. NJDZ02]|uniref:hypothetical protein n=1 Tax=Psychroserpens sp. NJDZ02 TaxID=2570561 RepID=UPI0010A9032C|nr:hypothetical protein [Psychroserpens sp. NJDZ02]QCE43067.1 hypothetical protein E9099_17125 [Psychroserpens sp. NJDZ02]